MSNRIYLLSIFCNGKASHDANCKTLEVMTRDGSRISSQGGALKKIAPSRGRCEKYWGISCKKSRFYAKKSYFFQFQGGRAPGAPPLEPSTQPLGILGSHLWLPSIKEVLVGTTNSLALYRDCCGFAPKQKSPWHKCFA